MDLLSSDEEEVKLQQKRPDKAKNKAENSKGDISKIVVNQKFAKDFERQQKLNDLQRSKELSLRDDDESDDSNASSEDDEANLLSSNMQLNIINTINSIRKRDPKIYDKDVRFFNDEVEDEDDDTSGSSGDDNKNNSKSKGSKKVTYKDVIRDQLLTQGADAGGDGPSRRVGDTISTSKLAYDKEQETLRRAFINSTKGDSDNENDSGNSDSDVGMLTVKTKSNSTSEVDRQLDTALTEMRSLSSRTSSSKDKKSSKSSSNSSSKANDILDENAKDDFLSNYISSKKWKDSTFFSKSNEEDEVSSSEDEAALDLAEKFENKYNFRFEELEGNEAGGVGNSIVGNTLSNVQVLGHARTTKGSLRRDDEKRKKERELRKERKEKEKKQKEAELRRLKNLKRQELQDRLRKIADLGGLKDLGLEEDDLEDEWDPAKHDEMMAAQYGDEYYNGNDDNFDKPPDVGDDAWMYEDNEKEEEEEAEEEEEDEKNYVAASKPTAKKLLSRKERKALKRQGVSQDELDDVEGFLSARKGESSAAASMLDELYQLDYEDIVAGIPCRFKYKQVEAQDFGLSIDEIVAADDNDLNSLVSLKHLATYNRKAIDTAKLSKKRKRLRTVLKDKVKEMNELLEKMSDESKDKSKNSRVDSELTGENEGPQKKKRRHKKKKAEDPATQSNSGTRREKDYDDDEKVEDDEDDGDDEPKRVSSSKQQQQQKVESIKNSKPVIVDAVGQNKKKAARRHKKGGKDASAKDKRMDLYS